MNETQASIATRVHATYRAAALRQVARGAWTRDEAARRLAPWGAITALCGGDVPGYTDRFDDLYPAVQYPSKTRGPAANTDDTRRFLLAEELSPDNAWRPVLATARAEAAVRADQLRNGGEADQLKRAMATWRDLDALARFLGLSLRMLCEAQAAASHPDRIAA